MAGGPVLGVAGAMQKIKPKLSQRLYGRAVQYSEINVRNHANAPRGGSTTNRYGQPRSAPGEPAATEDRNLLALMEMPPVPTPDGKGYSVFGNYRVLEDGTRYMGARPNAAIAIAELKREVNGGS